MADRFSIAAFASAARVGSVTVAVTTMPKFTSPAPLASSSAVAIAARVPTTSRAVGRSLEVMLKLAARRSDWTIAAARATSIGR